MSDILNFLRSYPDEAAAVMSKARVAETIAEIERLTAERDALRNLLCEARDWLSPDPADGQLLARIDAALKGDGDE